MLYCNLTKYYMLCYFNYTNEVELNVIDKQMYML